MAIRKYDQHTPHIAPSAFVDASAVVTGNVTIEADASVWPQVSIRGDLMPITIGARTNIQDNSCLHTSQDTPFYPGGAALVIGNDVTIGHGVILHGCKIHDLCLVGMGAIVMDDAIVETESMVAAGALVPPKAIIESGFVYMGSPAKKVRPLTQKEKEYLRHSAVHYAGLKDKHSQP